MVIYMLHIVLILLKIIGILLCIILGLLLTFILVVLFVPIRYGLWADNREELQGRVKVTWLLRLISFQITYNDKKLSIKLKIFGRIFFDNNNPREANKRKGSKYNSRAKQKKSRKLRKQTSKRNAVTETGKNEWTADKNKADSISTEYKSLDNKKVQHIEFHDSAKPVIEIKEKEPQPETSPKESLEKNSSLKSVEDEKKIKEDLDQHIVEEKEDEFKFFHKIKEFFNKMKSFLLKIKGFFQKIASGFQKVKNIFHNIREGASNLISKWEKIKAFYKVESNKQGIKLSLYAIKKVVKHILPKKIKGQIEFGTGDPCSTGQALGAAACFYSIYGKSFQIIPNFNDEIFEGNIYMAGRIRIVTLLIIVVKLILNKNFKELIKNFRAFKEEL